LGEVKICEKMAQFDAKKFAENQPKKDTPREKRVQGKRNKSPRLSEKREKGYCTSS
jgi:elongation factor 1-gamma